jgi:hypothetical protein
VLRCDGKIYKGLFKKNQHHKNKIINIFLRPSSVSGVGCRHVSRESDGDLQVFKNLKRPASVETSPSVGKNLKGLLKKISAS